VCLAVHEAAYSQNSGNGQTTTAVRVLREGSPVVQRIKQTLEEPLHSSGLDFVEQPLHDVVHNLSQEYGIPILLDVPALDTNGLRSDEPVTIKLHGISLRSALRHMLRNLQLTSVIRDEVLLVTSQDEADAYTLLSVYDVRDLVDAEHGGSIENLAKVLSTAVGDRLSIQGLKPGTLIVAAPYSRHEEFRELLAAIRDASRPRNAKNADTESK
jgi:hypothetical protein